MLTLQQADDLVVEELPQPAAQPAAYTTLPAARSADDATQGVGLFTAVLLMGLTGVFGYAIGFERATTKRSKRRRGPYSDE